MNFFINNLPIAIVILLITLFSLHGWALANEGYFKFWQLDIVLHTLGGFVVGTFFIRFFYLSGYVTKPTDSYFVFLTFLLSFAALVGVGWEFFEFWFDTFVAAKAHMALAQLGVRDTMADLFFDLVGAACAGFLFLFSKKWRNKTKSGTSL